MSATKQPEFQPFTAAEEAECREAVASILPASDFIFRPVIGQALATLDEARRLHRLAMEARDIALGKLGEERAEIHAAWASLGGPVTPAQTLKEAIDEQLTEIEAAAKARNKVLAAAALDVERAKLEREKHRALRGAVAAALCLNVTVREQLEQWPDAVARMRQALLNLEG